MKKILIWLTFEAFFMLAGLDELANIYEFLFTSKADLIIYR